MDLNSVLALRMERQHLTEKAGEREYDALFADVSPVPTEFWCSPGSAPRMFFLADFDDYAYNHEKRATRQILKGRYRGGSVGYVRREDMELYAALYKKEPLLTPTQLELLSLLQTEGPLTVGQLKEMTGLLVKVISPALQKMQQAYLLFEDQADDDWDRGWYVLKSEFPDFDAGRFTRAEALAIVLKRFAYRAVFFDVPGAAGFYGLPQKEIKAAADGLAEEGVFVSDGDGYMLTEDFQYLKTHASKPPKSVFCLHRNDFYVKSDEKALKPQYKDCEKGVLYYLLIDGEIKGAVTGRFTFGSVEIDEIALKLPESEAQARREEVLAAVYTVCDREKSPFKKYNGKTEG